MRSRPPRPPSQREQLQRVRAELVASALLTDVLLQCAERTKRGLRPHLPGMPIVAIAGMRFAVGGSLMSGSLYAIDALGGVMAAFYKAESLFLCPARSNPDKTVRTVDEIEWTCVADVARGAAWLKSVGAA